MEGKRIKIPQFKNLDSEKEPVMRSKLARSLAVPMIAFGLLFTAGSAFAQTQDRGIIKICKEAGPGVALGTLFHFNVGSHPVTVPAGPSPGGTCEVVSPSFALNSQVLVSEIIPPGDTVTNIDVQLPNRTVAGTLNTGAGQVVVQVGTGVTEVTYTNKRTGYIEICKQGHVTGSFLFFVSPSNLLVVVPAGGCSHAYEVPAGPVTINEIFTTLLPMIGCSTIPASQQGPCNLFNQTSTVNVTAGDISAQTIAIITDGIMIPPPVDPTPVDLPNS
jgi:hypothetical protein